MAQKDYTASPMKDPRSYFTKEQMTMIIKACPTERDRLLLLTLARTGRRVSEIVRCLTPADIDFEKGLVNFKILKRKVPTRRLQPVHPSLLKRMRKYIRAKRIGPHEHIFPISRQRVDQIIKKAAASVGIYKVGTGAYNKPHAHIFRHSFAIEAAKRLTNPADLVQLKEIMGHSRVDTTMFYLRFNPTEKRKLLEKMWKNGD